jgi:hypothetical protein
MVALLILVTLSQLSATLHGIDHFHEELDSCHLCITASSTGHAVHSESLIFPIIAASASSPLHNSIVFIKQHQLGFSSRAPPLICQPCRSEI